MLQGTVYQTGRCSHSPGPGAMARSTAGTEREIMHLRGKVALVGRSSAGRQLAVAMATAGLVVGLSATPGMASAAEAAATSPGRAVSATSLADLKIVPDVSGFQLENAHSAKCLSSRGLDNVDALQYGCSTSPNQRWQWGGRFGGTAFDQLVNQGTHQCLGISAAAQAGGQLSWSGGASVLATRISTGTLVRLGDPVSILTTSTRVIVFKSRETVQQLGRALTWNRLISIPRTRIGTLDLFDFYSSNQD